MRSSRSQMRFGTVSATIAGYTARTCVSWRSRRRRRLGAVSSRHRCSTCANPVIDQLVQGTEVSIYEEQPVSGVAWYRIGTNRWVHSAYVRLIQLEAARDMLEEPGAPADAVRLPVGWVVSSSINVRARPGVSAGNPVIGEVFLPYRRRPLGYRPMGSCSHIKVAAGQHPRKRTVGRCEPEPADLRRLRR